MKKRMVSILVVAIGMIALINLTQDNSQNIVVAKESNVVVKVETPESFPVVKNSVLETKIELEKVAQKIEKEMEEKKAAEEKAKREKAKKEKEMQRKKWKGEVLTASKGVVQGPSGKETYYNLDMSGVVKIMRNQGYSEEKYPYHVREDGVKMLGPYIMCAANLHIRPRGTILETSLGTAIVCDTGGFAKTNSKQVDIAVSW